MQALKQAAVACEHEHELSSPVYVREVNWELTGASACCAARAFTVISEFAGACKLSSLAKRLPCMSGWGPKQYLCHSCHCSLGVSHQDFPFRPLFLFLSLRSFPSGFPPCWPLRTCALLLSAWL